LQNRRTRKKSKISKSCLAALFAAAASACAPLEQAPLIYSAAEKGGLFVSTSPSSTSIIDVSIGWSVIDTAYVPVEVAKHCTSAIGCTGEDFKMRDVRGNSTTQSSAQQSLTSVQYLAEAYTIADNVQKDSQRTLTSAATKLADDRELVEAAKTADDLVQTDNTALTLATKQATQAVADSPLAIAVKTATEKLNADTQLAKIADTKALGINLATDNQAVADAQAKVSAANTATETALKALQDVFGRGPNTDDKGDALSVFGSFNSNTSAGGPAAGQVAGSLTLGKIFATGVAAQNVSVGLTSSAVSSCLVDATAASNGISDPTKRQAAFAALVQACGDGH
jgi:hypothetical protein